MKIQADRIGTIGLFITAITSPCCFPLFGVAFASLGFGSFELFGGWTMWVFQSLVLLSLAGTFVSYRQHRCLYPLLIALPSALLIFIGYHFINNDYWVYYLYAGMFGLLIAAGVNYYRTKLHNRMKIELISVVTCPFCGHQKSEQMPINACTYFYECTSCRTRLKPKPGDCCIFCSYGTVKCPPVQQGNDCCS
ncbi:MAG: MerC domain-containing protein [Bacteroidetes bacterium]|nr:MerC domain-containing protein [Bacteroidota bacterium]